ncbi:hypothetical protein FTUN_8548 [Frigoriglobus tundricola]|uniref:Uncharacterized protein n=1 Tax=Frigoriglobus tundricola TaxID=2774151 RepID=A0A6M5Z3B3_9BACT|nr:hypothetical protein FTUN_8548 [Frigoriglobus tundricola]
MEKESPPTIEGNCQRVQARTTRVERNVRPRGCAPGRFDAVSLPSPATGGSWGHFQSLSRDLRRRRVRGRRRPRTVTNLVGPSNHGPGTPRLLTSTGRRDHRAQAARLRAGRTCSMIHC